MPFLIRLLCPLLFICACLLGFLAIGGLGPVDINVAQISISVCIALSALSGSLSRYSVMRSCMFTGGSAAHHASSGGQLSAKPAAPAQTDNSQAHA